MDHILLIILWIAWCSVHSALISITVTDFLRQRFPDGFRYYRIFYNLFAILTLVPVMLYSNSLRSVVVFEWHGAWRIIPIIFGATALFFFVAGARRYDFLQFVGLRQANDGQACNALTEDCSLDTGGILSVVRHPWYTGALLVIWARPLDMAAILTNLVLSAYLILGTMLEERKLILAFGEQYVDYQQRVSMLLPIKWLRLSLAGQKPG